MQLICIILLVILSFNASEASTGADFARDLRYYQERYEGYLKYVEAKKKEVSFDEKSIEEMKKKRTEFEEQKDLFRYEFLKTRRPKPVIVDDDKIMAEANADWIKEREKYRKAYKEQRQELLRIKKQKYQVPEDEDAGLKVIK